MKLLNVNADVEIVINALSEENLRELYKTVLNAYKCRWPLEFEARWPLAKVKRVPLRSAEKTLARAGLKIEAIKMYRARSNASLRDSKEAVDMYITMLEELPADVVGGGFRLAEPDDEGAW